VTIINALLRRMIEVHESSVGHIAGMRRIHATVSGLSSALIQVYVPGIGVVKAMIETIARLGKTLQSLRIARLISGLLPVLEARSTEFESAVSGLEPLKLVISRRFTGVIPRIISRPLRQLRKLGIPSYERAGIIPTAIAPSPIQVLEEGAADIHEVGLKMVGVYRAGAPVTQIPSALETLYERVAPIPSTALVIHPLTLEAVGAIADHISKISEAGRRTLERAPAMATRVGIYYTDRLLKVTRRVSSRGLREARSVQALEMRPRLEAMEAVREFWERLAVSVPMTASPIVETIRSRYVVDVSKVGRIPRSVTMKAAEGYVTRVFEPVSKIHEVSKFVGIATLPRARAIEIVEAARLLLAVLEMERGLRLVTEEAAMAYLMKATGMAPSPIQVLEGEVAEAPPRVAARYAPSIISISTLIYELARRTIDVHEIGLKMAEVYGAGAPIIWTPSVLETARVSSDYIERISSMVTRGVAPFSLSVSAIPSVIEVIEAVPRVRSISELTSRVTSFKIPVTEREKVSKHIAAVPETTFRFIAEKLAETYKIVFLSLTPLPLGTIDRSIKPVAHGMKELPSVGAFEAPREYPAAEVMEMVKILPSTVSIVGERFPAVVKEKYLGILAEAPPISEYVVTETKFGIVSGLLKSFELMKGGVKELPMAAPIVAPKPSLVEITKVAGRYVAAALETRRAIDGFGAISRAVITYRVDVEKAIKSSLGGVVTTGLPVSLEGVSLGRVLLRGPPSVPTVRLHEIAPILYSVAAPTRTERPIQNVFNITIEERSIEGRSESLSGEIDLRELGRRVARILREEARRYGIHL